MIARVPRPDRAHRYRPEDDQHCHKQQDFAALAVLDRCGPVCVRGGGLGWGSISFIHGSLQYDGYGSRS